MINQHYDFRGGYVTDTTYELMKDNELITAENCTWDKGLVKRNGITKYNSTSFTAFKGLRGAIRAYINNTWYTILAVDNNTNVTFYSGATDTFTVIDSGSYTMTTGVQYSFAELLSHVVICNGVDKPAVIYWDGSKLALQSLEAHDTRTRDNGNWWAGQYDAAGGTYIFNDDTTDAQDTGVDDFQIASTTNGDGCYIACDFTFNKVIFYGCDQEPADTADTFTYWNGSSWTAITPTTAPDWDAAAGNRTLEFDIPLSSTGGLLWERYDPTLDTGMTYSLATGIENKYVVKCVFAVAPAATIDCDYIAIFHTQYLTQIFSNAKPHLCYTHNNTMFLAERNIINMSPYKQVTGWRADQLEYFIDGGSKITALYSYKNNLVVFKDSTIYNWDVNNLLAPTRSRPLSDVGTLASRSVAEVGGYLFFVGRDGIYLWDGNRSVKVSKHIQTDIDSYTIKDTHDSSTTKVTDIGACGVGYKNKYWVAFPQNDVILVADPDSFRTDEAGDGGISFFKFTTSNVTEVDQFILPIGGGDALNGILFGIVDNTTPYLMKMDNSASAQDSLASATNITFKVQTKYFNFFESGMIQLLNKIKIKVLGVSSSTEADRQYKLNLYRDDGVDGTDISPNTDTITLTTDNLATGYGEFYEAEYTIPYYCDGFNFSLKLEDSTSGGSPKVLGLIGFSLNSVKRRF